MVADDLHALELVEQAGQQVGAVVANVEVGVALLQAASDLAQARALAVVLVGGDDVYHGFFDELLAGEVATALAVALHQQLEGGEDVAGLAERHRGLLLAHADDGEAALAQAHSQAGEVGVGGDDAESFHRIGVEDIHGVDDHGRVCGVLTLGVAELLNRRDGILQQHLLPLNMAGQRPVAIDALVGDGAVFRQLIEDGLQVLCGDVVRVDEQRETLLGRLLIHDGPYCRRMPADR